MVKRLATSPHDPLGITDSACKNQSVVVGVLYGPFNPYIPIRSTTIGKSRVARDPITMHTSWRSNSDIASVTSIGYLRMSASGESSTTMHRLLHASGSHPIPTPGDPKEQECVGCSDSEASSSETSSSRESEDEVHCLIADDIEEVFVFSSPEFTHEDLVNALNEMVLDNKKLSQSLEEVKCERESCATSVELVSSINMQAALSKLETENEKLRSRSKEILCENQRLAGINVATKPSGDRTGLGHNSDEGSTAETSSTSRLERTKFKTMNFVKSSSEHPEEAHSDELRKTAEPTI
ncbi:spindle pole body component 110-like [Dorcoceras hygrometricum]|uniref:Spindle pole body component 110-like n=1 Tax=Dorcoceras hygrometricum TaxID=472368 RepID=A0A2Z7ALI8_9LAMI|nr:spindle pole body component 110-like [Dorcoceras hygrometricum]